MKERGWSLVEVVVVIGIMSILLAVGTLKFSDWFKRYRKEAQTRMIYTEVIRARSSALTTRRGTRVKILPDLFEVYSTQTDSTDPIVRSSFRYRVELGEGGSAIDFDARGITTDTRTVCIEAAGDGAVDSIIIGNARTRIGKRENGQECKSDGIVVR